MFQAPIPPLTPVLMARLTLLINHILASEPEAQRRMQLQSGRLLRLDIERWPAWLPAWPVLAYRITPAGLLEWQPGAEADPDLRIRLDAPNPAELAIRAVLGDRPALAIEGDAELAADLDWLIRNLRWDIAADLDRLFGPVVAAQVQALGTLASRAFKSARDGMSRFSGRGAAPTGSPADPSASSSAKPSI
jgi:ubiquinone biosynthesis protein UbiJ